MSWEIRTREHTFKTGRTATLREQLPTTELIRHGVLTDDALAALQELVDGKLGDPAAAARLSDAICLGMFVEPELTLEAKPTKGKVPIGVLDEGEIMETIELAFDSVAGVAGFRRQPSRSRARGDGKVLEEGAKRPARPRARKPRGAGARPKAR